MRFDREAIGVVQASEQPKLVSRQRAIAKPVHRQRPLDANGLMTIRTQPQPELVVLRQLQRLAVPAELFAPAQNASRSQSRR